MYDLRKAYCVTVYRGARQTLACGAGFLVPANLSDYVSKTIQIIES